MLIPIACWPAADKAQIFRYLNSASLMAAHRKMLCVVVPAVGCVSIRAWFARLQISSAGRQAAPSETLEQALGAPDFFRFAVVRNPYRRIFSAWQSKLLLRDPAFAARYHQFDFFNCPINDRQELAQAFEAFLEHLAEWETPLCWDAHWTPQTVLLRPDLIQYAALLRIEEPEGLRDALARQIDETIDEPAPWLIPDEDLLPFRPDLITTRSAELIRTLYADDFLRLGYSDRLPEPEASFSDDELSGELRAISFLRARHAHEAEARHQAEAAHKPLVMDHDRILGEIQSGKAWRLVRLLSRLRHDPAGHLRAMLSHRMRHLARSLWAGLPLSPRYWQMLRCWIRRVAVRFRPPVSPGLPLQSCDASLAHRQPYRQWALSPERSDTYVPALQPVPPAEVQARLICFYLPQFHAIPENDRWWGEGFTEWSNVRPAMPQFNGHYQPHEPGELGYYNLLDPGVQQRQIDLAKRYGISGFCFYFYWFAGQRLLEAPLLNYLSDSSLDLPFCLCWANENWTRTWSGLEQDVLMAQRHSPEDDLAFIRHVARYLRDPRYLRIDGRPLLLVYRPGLLPSTRETADRWRRWCREQGIGEIHLTYTQSFETVDPALYGFDAAVEFPPNNSAPPDITAAITPHDPSFSGAVYDWRVFVERSEHYADPGYKLFRGVCPSWDNTARRGSRATIFRHSTPAAYEYWLENAIADAQSRHASPDERLVFINAWNEWAEGAHLEPDRRHGHAWLQATRNALVARSVVAPCGILLMTHDCHPHGAQYLALAMARQFIRSGCRLVIVAQDGGPLQPEFAALGEFLILRDAGGEGLQTLLLSLRRRGFADALASTTVCGDMLPLVKRCGFRVASLVHELPGVISSMGLERQAARIAQHADLVVFPADMVHEGFAATASVPADRVMIRPQGLLRKNPWLGRRIEAGREVRRRHQLSEGVEIILAVGYADQRKGVDLFVEVAARVCRSRPQAVFLWVGHADTAVEQMARCRIDELGLRERIVLVGFDPEPLVYYAAASVYALTSREDPFPNVVLESIAVGVPVVAFAEATGAADFIVSQGGLLAHAFEVDDFAARLLALLERGAGTVPPLPGELSLQRYNLDILHRLNGRPRVSVVVPNYNYAELIRRRLDSIERQTYPLYEVIVLDDASTDHSIERIQAYCRETGSDAGLIANETNSGSVFRQWLKGVRMARGDLVWIAEADDVCSPELVARLVAGFSEPGVVMAFSQSWQMGDHDDVLASDYLAYTADISDRWQTDHVIDGREEIREALAIKNVIPNVSAVLFDRQALLAAFEAAGDALFEYRVAGDWLIYLHVLMQGRLYYNARPLNGHRRHQGSVTSSAACSRHWQEVAQLQTMARELVAPDERVRVQAADYLVRLREQFGLGAADIDREAVHDAAS